MGMEYHGNELNSNIGNEAEPGMEISTDEGMTNRPLMFAYLVSAQGR
jgi:hypothetical protein